MSEKVLNTIILDDNPVFRESIRGLLSRIDHIRVILETGSAETAMEMIEKETPHLMIADIRLPGMSGIELAGVLKERYPGMDIILITLYDNDRYRKEAGRLGFSYIPKSSLLEDLPLLLNTLLDQKQN